MGMSEGPEQEEGFLGEGSRDRGGNTAASNASTQGGGECLKKDGPHDNSVNLKLFSNKRLT